MTFNKFLWSDTQKTAKVKDILVKAQQFLSPKKGQYAKIKSLQNKFKWHWTLEGGVVEDALCPNFIICAQKFGVAALLPNPFLGV